MKKMFSLVVVLYMTCVAVGASDGSEQFTDGRVNGRYWVSSPFATRLAYIFGFMEALGETKGDYDSMVKYYGPGKLTFAEDSVAIDRFYLEPENLPIPVSEAMHIVAMKTAGESQAKIDEKISFDRKTAGSLKP